MEMSWIVIVPPLLVLIIAFATRNVLYALLGGIISASYLLAQRKMFAAVSMLIWTLVQETSLPSLLQKTGEYDHAYTFGFLILLGILIELMTHSGGFHAYTAYMQKFIRSARQASFLPLIAAPFFFLDDYLNNLVMGSIVRPIFDCYHLARSRLAYVLNATSSAQCLLIPLSSWAAVIMIQLKSAGISCSAKDMPILVGDPYALYLAVIPCMLYPILSIFSAWIVTCMPYGPIAQEESQLARKRPKTVLRESQAICTKEANRAGSLSSLLVPLGTFLVAIPNALMLHAGWRPVGESIGWCQALKQVDGILIALFWASFIAVLVSSIFFRLTKRLSWGQIVTVSYSGFMFMKNSLLLLLFSWSLTTLLKGLGTSAYIAQTLLNNAPVTIIPVLCFFVATFITAAIGSSWGMMSIMIPLLVPLVVTLSARAAAGVDQQIAFLIPVLGALFSGAAAGPHFSPITDAAIISSATAGLTPIQHIQTMIVYALAPLLSSALGFILLAYMPATLWSRLSTLGIVMVITLGLHALGIYRYNRKQNTKS